MNFGGDRTERETDLIADFDAFYDELRSAEQLPTTSQPSVGDFVEVYEPLLAEGGDVVSIHLSEGISGHVRLGPPGGRAAARRTARAASASTWSTPQTAAGGMGLIVLGGRAGRAARRRRRGRRRRGPRSSRESLKMWFAVDTLEFLKRSGRIGAASAWIGSTLKIKPILTLEQEITPIERVRTSGRAFERLVDYAEERHEAGADGWVVQHIQSRDAGRAARGALP